MLGLLMQALSLASTIKAYGDARAEGNTELADELYELTAKQSADMYRNGQDEGARKAIELQLPEPVMDGDREITPEELAAVDGVTLVVYDAVKATGGPMIDGTGLGEALRRLSDVSYQAGYTAHFRGATAA